VDAVYPLNEARALSQFDAIAAKSRKTLGAEYPRDTKGLVPLGL
jgi:hypothetical protein